SIGVRYCIVDFRETRSTGAPVSDLVRTAAATPQIRLPVEVVQQARQRQLHGRHGEPHPGASSPPGAERHGPEVLPGHQVVRREVVAGEPLRHELVGALPRGGVPRDGPRVDDDAGARWHVVAEQLRVHGRLPGYEERQRRAQPQRLLDDAPEVAQLLEVVLGDATAAADGRADLVLDLAHLAWDNGLDGHVVERGSTGVRLVLVHVQQHVDEVPVIVTTFTVAATAPPAVVRDHLFQEGIHLRGRACGLGVQPHERVNPGQPGHELPHGDGPQEPLKVGEQL
ncbi:hypothetical protein ACJX0J_015108, partial [Zea mays]